MEKVFYKKCYFNSSILNKLTPEKFDKLSLELLNVGIANQVILKGIILLVCYQLVRENFVSYLSIGALLFTGICCCRYLRKP